MPTNENRQAMHKRIAEELGADFIVDEKITVGDRPAYEELADRIVKIVEDCSKR